MIVHMIDYFREHAVAVKNFCYIGVAILLVWSFTGVDTHHAHTWAEKHIPGFWSLFGTGSCIVLIFFARWFGKSGIMTREDYYDN